MNDILDNKSLKTMPYKVPEGYFEELKDNLRPVVRHGSPWRKVSYTAIAATVALLIGAGAFLLKSEAETDFTQEDYLVFSDDMTNTIFYSDDELYAEAVTEDDIIEYLIYIDTEIEELY